MKVVGLEIDNPIQDDVLSDEAFAYRQSRIALLATQTTNDPVLHAGSP